MFSLSSRYKHDCCGNASLIMLGIWPNLNERWNCNSMVQNVQSWTIERVFKMKSELVGRPSAVSDDLVQSERWRFTLSEIPCEFRQISRAFLFRLLHLE
jgi:hypothetical protein